MICYGNCSNIPLPTGNFFLGYDLITSVVSGRVHPSFPDVQHSDFSWKQMCSEWNQLTPPTHKRQLLLDESMLDIPAAGSPFSKSSLHTGTSPFLSANAPPSTVTVPELVSTSTQIVSPISAAGGKPASSIFSFLVGAVSGTNTDDVSLAADEPAHAARSPLSSVAPAAVPQQETEEEKAARLEKLLREYL